jgi:hypothetical protein
MPSKLVYRTVSKVSTFLSQTYDARSLFLILFFLCCHLSAYGEKHHKLNYPLVDDPIDVVIVSHPKDKETLDYCIEGIAENGRGIRRVIVVSGERLSDKAEWFDEKQFPFSLDDVLMTIAKGDRNKGEEFFRHHNRPVGWYLQQLLKLYAAFVIPGISSNVLVIDADTIFMNPVKFLNEGHGGLFGFNTIEPKKRYLKHAKRFLPGYKRIHSEVYSVCHHMLFQRPILEDLFNTVEQHHHTPFWVAFCSCVDLKENKGAASEYEIYFSYAFNHTDQVGLRKLKWTNSVYLDKMEGFKKRGYHYVSFHSYKRERVQQKHH